MSSGSVESRIVTMKFDNGLFQQAAAATMSTLDKLKLAVTGLPSASKGIETLNTATSRFSMGNMLGEVQSVSTGFLSMATVGITALANITNRAVDAGINIAKALTINPISQGFGDYETKINAVQTILANTAAQGTKLPDVTAALGELNKYANLTVYNFAEMARNVGTFTAAGVDLKTSVASIKGIANLAALSGSSSAQASSAMYQLSQAIAAGQVHLQDWNSVVNAGIGGAVFQKSLVRTAQTMGTISKNAVKTEGPMHTLTVNGESFRNSLTPKPGEASWLTTDVLTKTLSQFTGDMTAAQLAAQGFNKAQTKAILAQAKTASNAATQVKTFSQLMQSLKEEVATAWSNIFGTIFGNINQAKRLFSPLHTTIENALTVPIYKMNTVLEKWSKMGGRFKFINGLKMAFSDIWRLIQPIKNAFRDIFPPVTARNLMSITRGFDQFTRHLSISKGVMKDLRSTFDGVFSVLAIGVDIVKNIIRYFATFIGLILKGIFPAAKGIFDFTGNVGDMLTKLKEFLVDGGKIDDVFTKIINGRAKLLGPLFISIGKVIGAVFKLLSQGLTWLFNILSKAAPYIAKPFDWLAQALTWVSNNLSKLAPYVDKVTSIFSQGFGDVSDNVKKLAPDLDKVKSFVEKIYNIVKAWVTLHVGDAMNWISDHKDDFQAWADAAGNFVHSGFDKIVEWLSKLKPYAEDVAKLAAALAALPFIAVGKLASALGPAMANMGGSLKKGLSNVLGGIAGSASGLLGKIDLSSIFSFGGGATSQVTGGIKSVGNELKKTAGIADFVKAAWEQVEMLFKSFVNDFLKPLAPAMGKIFSFVGDSIKHLFKGLNFQDIIALVNTGFFILMYRMVSKFFGSLGGLAKSAGETLDAVTGNLKAMQTEVKSKAIMNIAIAIGILAAALFVLSRIDPKALGYGLGAVATMLAEVVGALMILERGFKVNSALRLIVLSVAIDAISGAVLVMAGAVAILGRMKTSEIIRGLGAIAGILALLTGTAAVLEKSGGAKQMIGAAIAIGIMSGALLLLAGAIELYSKIDTKTLVNGGIKVAAVIIGLAIAMQFFSGGALSGAAALLVAAVALRMLISVLQEMGKMSWSEIGKSMVELAGAMLILGLAMAGMEAGLPGAAALIAMAIGLQLLMPVLVQMSQLSWDTIKSGLEKLAVVLGALALIAVVVAVPLAVLGVAIVVLGEGMLLAGAGMLLFGAGLTLVAAAGAAAFSVLEAGITSMLTGLPLWVQQFGLTIHAIAKVIRKEGPVVIAALGALVRALLNQIKKNIPAFGRVMTQLIHTGLKVIRNTVPDFIHTGIFIITSFLRAVESKISKITKIAISIVLKFIAAINSKMGKIVDAAVKMIIKFMNALAGAINKHQDQIRSAALNIGWAIIHGVISGLNAGLKWVIGAAEHIASAAIQAVKNKLHSNSPSKVFMEIGKDVNHGFAIGLDKHSHISSTAAGNMANRALETVKTSMDKIHESLPNHLEMNPTINPVLDLTRLQREATKIGGLFGDNPVRTDVSFRHAKGISSDHQAAYLAALSNNETQSELVKEIKFEQHNSSPKALSAVEIYRNTRNLINLSKEALSKA